MLTAQAAKCLPGCQSVAIKVEVHTLSLLAGTAWASVTSCLHSKAVNLKAFKGAKSECMHFLFGQHMVALGCSSRLHVQQLFFVRGHGLLRESPL